jgi:DNA polymerase I
MPGSLPRLYLIDGSSYIYRAFFALPPLTSPSGLPTNAVYGFTTMILKLLAEVQPQYVGVIFDAPGATFRDAIYDQYKAHRPPAPDDLRAQIPFIHQVVDGFRIHCLTVPGVEADDVIATLTAKLAGNEVECVVVTGDKDLMQIVGEHVRLWDTMRDRWFDDAAVRERLGVGPERVVDFMALVGDAVDNIPGIKGIGEKTALALVQRFGDLDSILQHVDEVPDMGLRGAKKVAELLRTGAATARLSRELATVRRDVEVDCTLAAFRFRDLDVEVLRGLFNQFGFQSLARQLTVKAPTVPGDYCRAAEGDVEALASAATTSGWLALASLAAEGPAVTAPARQVFLVTQECGPLACDLADATVVSSLRGLLQDPSLERIGHDLKRELTALAAAGLSVAEGGFDLMIASYLTDASTTHDLPSLAADLLGQRLERFRDGGESLAAGLRVMRPLAELLSERLREMGVERLFRDVEMPLMYVLQRMERRGVLVDVEHLRGLSAEFGARLEALMTEIHSLAGEEFNINSPPQLRAVLFDRLGLSKKGVRRGKTGYSTDVDVLNRLAREHPLPAKILEYRALSKLKSTYVDALPAAVNSFTGRLHSSFNQTVAATGRLSSSDPNLQNIPIRGEEGRRIRAAFIAPPGAALLGADYSQIELRILAHLSADPALVEAFRTGQDIHTRTAVEVFGVLPGLVSGDMRRAAKVINFGILYGMGPQRLAQELGITQAEAQRYISSYFERYAGVRSYMRGVVEAARRDGFVSTLLGRRRAVPELRSGERGVAQAAERVAANTPIQGSAADVIKLAMIAVERRLETDGLRAHLVLQVHDELLLEVAEEDLEGARRAVREEMETAVALSVPLEVEIAAGRSWAEIH